MEKLMETEEGEEKMRIDAIKAPLSEMIDAIKIDEKNAENNTTLHLYEFSEGAGKLYKKGLGGFGGLKCDEEHILIKDENARKEAKEWVEKDLSAAGPNRPTWLYTSIDQVLTYARELQEADPNKPISFMVISDGADSEKGKFKNMAAVLKKHGKTFNSLDNKYFIELVGFDNEGKKAWGEKGGKVQPPKGMKELAEVARQMAAPKKVVRKIFVEFEMPAQEIWAIKKQGIRVEFINKSNGIIDDKPIPDADLKYEWKCEEEFKNKWVELWKDDQRTPNPQLFTEGKYKITLTVSNGNLKVPVEKFLTVRQFKPKIATVVTPNPTAGKEVVIQLIDYPIGSTFEIKGNPNEKITGMIDADKKEIRTKLIEAKTYELIVHLTLPGGESIELEGLKITTKNPKGEIFVSKNEPWIGEKVTFKSLTPIPDGVTAEYRWDLGDGTVKEDKIVKDYSYQTSGKKNVKLTIKRSDLATPQVAMFPPGEELVVKGINVQIGVAP